MKKVLALLLLCLLLAAACAEETDYRLEGPGYDTPEEAVLVYLEGMNEGDATKMLRTFAIESFAAHTDPASNIRRLASYTASSSYLQPLNGDYSSTLMASARYGDLARSLFLQYSEISTELGGTVYQAREPEERADILNRFEASPANGWQGNVTFVEWMDPASLNAYFLEAQNLRNVALTMGVAGAEDYATLAAHIRLNGTEALQTMDCIKYGGKWYNYALNSNIYMLLNGNIYMAGLLAPYGAEKSDAESLLGGAAIDPEAAALQEGWERSGLAGTRWQITSLKLPGIGVEPGVCATPEEALAAPEEYRACGEVRLAHQGGVMVRLTCSPAFAKMLTGAEDITREYFAGVWFAAEEDIEIGALRSIGNLSISDTISCQLSNGEMALESPDGFHATLTRLEE